MLKRMVQERLLELVSTSEVLESIAVGLIGTERFYELVKAEIKSSFSRVGVRAIVDEAVSEAVSEGLKHIVITVDENDFLVFPSAGIGSAEFARLTSAIPEGKRVGVIAADDIKILRLT